MVWYAAFTATTGSGVIADTTTNVNARMVERGGREDVSGSVGVQPDERVG
jgi:hypothetical protein